MRVKTGGFFNPGDSAGPGSIIVLERDGKSHTFRVTGSDKSAAQGQILHLIKGLQDTERLEAEFIERSDELARRFKEAWLKIDAASKD